MCLANIPRGAPAPSPLYSGERAGVRGFSRAAQFAEPPLTLTLSPEYRGEGTRNSWSRKTAFALAGAILAIAVVANNPLSAATNPAPSAVKPIPSDPAAEALMTSGALRVRPGRFAQAVASWQSAAAAFEKDGNLPRQIDSLMLLGAAYRSMGHATEAINVLDRAMKPAEAWAATSGDHHRLIALKDALGSACTFTEQADRAEKLLQ